VSFLSSKSFTVSQQNSLRHFEVHMSHTQHYDSIGDEISDAAGTVKVMNSGATCTTSALKAE
jgi:hypothetical protein